MRDMRKRQPTRGTGHATPAGRGRWLPAGALVTVLLLTSCGEGGEEPGAEGNDGHGGSEETMSGQDNEGSPGTDEDITSGLIDIEGGLTHEEQMAELEIVVEVMREYFGEDVATIDGEPWSVELHETEVTPRPRGDDVFRQRVGFDVPFGDLEETYEVAEEIAERLGLSENSGNTQGVSQYEKIFYGAGFAEGRGFLIASNTEGDGFRSFYRTRSSDDPSMREAYERVIDKNRREREEEFDVDNPRQLEDIDDPFDDDSSD
ncbi:hypothetical protein [Nesterenkonia suensis]